MLCVSPGWFEKMYSLLANITTHLHACLRLLQSMWDSVSTLLASKWTFSCFYMCDEHAGKPGNSGKWQMIFHQNASRRWLFLKSLNQYNSEVHIVFLQSWWWKKLRNETPCVILISVESCTCAEPILTRLRLKYLFNWLCLSNASWSVFEHCLNKDGREINYAPIALTSAGVKHQLEKGVKFSVSSQVKCFHLPGARAAAVCSQLTGVYIPILTILIENRSQMFFDQRCKPRCPGMSDTPLVVILELLTADWRSECSITRLLIYFRWWQWVTWNIFSLWLPH